MEITIDSTTENPLLKREEYTVTIDHSGEATPSADSVRKTFAAENDLDPDTVTIEDLNTNYGTNTARAVLKAYEEKVVESDEGSEEAAEEADDEAEADADTEEESEDADEDDEEKEADE